MQHDPLWMKVILAMHIASGSLAFVLAPVALIVAKGGKAHRRWGMVYFWAMAGVAVSAVIMAVYRPVLFLALVAIFSFYAVFNAYRVLSQKGAYRGEKVVRPTDWAAALFTFTASFLLAAFGLFLPAVIQHLAIPAVVFGILGMRLSGRSMWAFTHPPTEKMFWWYVHLQGMLGSYIAAWTAFLLVTVAPRLHLGWVLWLVPTAIGVPAIALTTAYYKRKFAPRQSTAIA
jgi:uncharacterized membrane protein